MNWERILRRSGIAAAAGAVLSLVAGFALGIGDFLFDSFAFQTAAGGAALGAVVATAARTQSHNRVVRLLALLSVIMVVEVGAYVLVGAYIRHGMGAPAYADLIGRELAPRDLPLPWAIVVWFPLWIWITSLGGFLTFGLLLFPDGQLPSRRWKPVAVVAAVTIGLLAVGYMILGWPTSDAPITGLEPRGFGGALISVGFPIFALCVFASLVSLILRYRSADDEVRHQLRWVLVGVSAVAIGFPIMIVGQTLGAFPVEVVNYGSLFLVPPVIAGYAVAILKYRLYDVDVVINRALVVAGLGAFITAVYISIVVGIGQLVGAGDEPNLGLSLIATAVVALAFQPARTRMQHWANVLVYGERATPYEVLARFSQTATESSEHQDLLVETADLLADALGASVTVWVRQHDELVPVASSPDGADAARPIAATDRPEDPRADLTTVVRGPDRLLGAISVAKPSSETLTQADRHLTEQLAGALGLLLRNRGLTEELAATVDDVARSRDRLLAAGDAARQMIDQSLRSQPLEQLESLDRDLHRLAETARRAAADKTSQILEQVAEDASRAADTVRELASGAYPPRLEAEGLRSALQARAAAAPFPVSIQVFGDARYPLPVETAVYFCVLEALQNATKYADPDSVQVQIENRDGELVFTVRDDGNGFALGAPTEGSGLSNLRDRLDTLDGHLDIDTAPGRGTTVRGTLPLQGQSPDGKLTRAVPTPTPPGG
ncbi:MAG: ATP-binding protein [Nitriliruptorales bacterium]|nr:ATP-binding protein [Nitriliruptorales bacterium]